MYQLHKLSRGNQKRFRCFGSHLVLAFLPFSGLLISETAKNRGGPRRLAVSFCICRSKKPGDGFPPGFLAIIHNGRLNQELCHPF